MKILLILLLLPLLSIPVAFAEIIETQEELFDTSFDTETNIKTISSVSQRINIDDEWVNFKIN